MQSIQKHGRKILKFNLFLNLDEITTFLRKGLGMVKNSKYLVGGRQIKFQLNSKHEVKKLTIWNCEQDRLKVIFVVTLFLIQKWSKLTIFGQFKPIFPSTKFPNYWRMQPNYCCDIISFRDRHLCQLNMTT